MKDGWKSCGSVRAEMCVWMVVVAAVLSAGGQTMPMSYVGRSVPVQKQAPLASEGTHSAVYRTEDLIVDFKYSRNQSVLELSGSIRFTDRLARGFKRIEGFHADVYFMNENGVVMDSQGLVTSASDSSDSSIKFKLTVTVPQDIVAISFAYTGQAVGGGGQSGAQVAFWEYPAQ